MIKFLKKILSWDPPVEKCQHEKCTRTYYGGFFGFENYECVKCNYEFNDDFFSKSESLKEEHRALLKRVREGKIKVVDLNTEDFSNFNDGSLERNIKNL